MNGPHLDDELSALLDGELHGAEHDDAVAHLRQCAFCTSELAAVERTRSLVRALPMVDPPNALAPRREQKQAPRGTGWIAAAAAALVFVALQAMAPDHTVNVAVAGLVDAHTAFTVVTTPASPETIEVVLADTRTGDTVERAALDSTTGAVLWRQHDAAAARAHHRIPTPERLDGGYERVGLYRHDDVVHELFSDGLHTLSVFAQPGELDESGLPTDRRIVAMGKQQASHYDWPEGDVLVWESGGVVFAAVGDAPAGEVMAAAASMPKTGALSVGERLKRGCRALADAVTGAG